jgi:hypothetical protein
MKKLKLLRLSFFFAITLFSGIARSECAMTSHKIYGVVTNSSGQKIPAEISFTWVENGRKQRFLATLADSGDYSVIAHFDTQSKADQASGLIYDCNAKLSSIQYHVEALDYTPLLGGSEISFGYTDPSATQLNFKLQPNSSILMRLKHLFFMAKNRAITFLTPSTRRSDER